MAQVFRRHAVIGGVGWSWFAAGGPGSAVPLVLLHGGGGTGKGFTAQLEVLGEERWVLAPDLPGFGQSDRHPRVATADDIAPVLAEWMAALGIDQAVVGGNSMGGRVALQMAAAGGPPAVRGLVLLDALGIGIRGIAIQNPLDFPPDRFVEGLVYDPERYRRLTPYRTLEDLAELTRGRQVFAEYRANAARRQEEEDADVLRKVGCPALLIWGKEDRVLPLEYGRALLAALPRAEMVVLEECGHLPHVEQPQLVNRLMADFLRRIAG